MRAWIPAVVVILGVAPPSTKADPADARDIFLVVDDGKPACSILVAPGASPAVMESASLLKQYVERATGVVLPVVDQRPSGPCIHVGRTESAADSGLSAADLGPQEFVITFDAEGHLTILGGSDIGTHYGVLEFLEEYVGVRWLFPGDLGEHVPALKRLAIPRRDVREGPAFLMRWLSSQGFWESAKGSDHYVWAYRLRMKPLIAFHHNMHNLFAASTYGKDHPEFYHVRGGKRRVPASDAKEHRQWNPCWTAPGIVDEAAKNICAYFDARPAVDSYSLGINDVTSRCECPACARAYEKNGSVGHVYYHWVNAVAQEVGRKHPHRKLGLLAYFEAMPVPHDLKLHGAVVPFVCYELMRWADPELEARGHTLTENWLTSATELGWYDYIYGGKTYLIPRAWYHLMADYLRYGRDHHVRYYYAEAYPADHWPDGPKLYLTLKLLWNPDLDVDALLDEWCSAAVGEGAAPHLRMYFDFWEDYWTRRVPTMKNYFRGGGILLPSVVYGSKAYMDLLTADDLKRVESLMAKVVTLAGPGRQRRRAELFQNSVNRALGAVAEYKRDDRDSLMARLPAVRFNGQERGELGGSAGRGFDLGNDDFIVEFWCRPDTTSLPLLEKGRPGSSGTIGIQIGTSGVALDVNLKGAAGSARVRSAYHIIDRPGHWYHLFLVFDRDGQLRVFRNTKAHGAGDISSVGSLSTDDTLCLGYRHDRYYQGVLGAVRIYRFDGVPIPSDERLAPAMRYNYDHPSEVADLLEPHLAARWEMGGTSTKLIRDLSGNGRDLTLTGGP